MLEALDELGLIAVGVERAGNRRVFSERAQLMLDVIETARRRFHVDPRRIYMTGMSGGGRVTSAFSVCFPDVIRGSVPIADETELASMEADLLVVPTVAEGDAAALDSLDGTVLLNAPAKPLDMTWAQTADMNPGEATDALPFAGSTAAAPAAGRRTAGA